MPAPATFALLAVTAWTVDDPEGCPWCQDDPEVLARLSAVSHAPGPMMRKSPEDFVRELPATQWVFLETPHLRFASSLGPAKLKPRDRQQLAAELERLRELIPDFPKRPKVLDPWARLHLLALQAEDFYTRFQELLGVSDEDFPAERRNDQPYMGAGPYLGEMNKFEIVYHASRGTHNLLTRDEMGVEVTDALRWHFSPEHAVVASIPAEDADLRQEVWLIPHTAHLLSHMLLSAYKHFSYDPPIWLDEGLAHALEREIHPLSTTIDGDEGGGKHRGGHEDWSGRDVLLARRGQGPTFADMLRWNAFHDLEAQDHVAIWSRAVFLIEKYPDELAQFLGGVKGQLDDQGHPTGRDLVGLQRRLLKEIWGWTPAEFDDAWRAWRLEEND